ncbi:hypothetical protein SAMN05444487_101141 [Marininema mesophilum]|uniref:Uncharacterized protein n=1 Tax=Marininema mesophilum TaxID=1048340 RepID=A0A1H2Q9G4_9BACL|nr:hypothetical protein SAMN05444487_101141 [Marininema mesophilum]
MTQAGIVEATAVGQMEEAEVECDDLIEEISSNIRMV